MSETKATEGLEKLDEIAKAVGGRCVLAKLLDIKPPSMYTWFKTGQVPWKRVDQLIEIATQHDIAVDRSDLRPDIWPKENTVVE